MQEKELMRPADLAPTLGVSVRRVYQLIRAGEIPAVRVGGALRIPRLAWQNWLWDRSEAARQPLESRPAEHSASADSEASDQP
jgi:excisionase family DNA binding protein